MQKGLFRVMNFCFILTFSFLFNILKSETLNNPISNEDLNFKTNSDLFKHSISISINDLLIRRILLNYSTLIKQQTFADFTFGYKYHGSANIDDDNSLVSDYLLERTCINYNQFVVRFGIKKYIENNSFIEIMANYNHDFNKNLKNWNEGADGYLFANYKNEIGALLKMGIVIFQSNHIISEGYFGFGVQKSYNSNSPLEYNIWIEPTIFFGITIGLKY